MARKLERDCCVAGHGENADIYGIVLHENHRPSILRDVICLHIDSRIRSEGYIIGMTGLLPSQFSAISAKVCQNSLMGL